MLEHAVEIEQYVVVGEYLMEFDNILYRPQVVFFAFLLRVFFLGLYLVVRYAQVQVEE